MIASLGKISLWKELESQGVPYPWFIRYEKPDRSVVYEQFATFEEARGAARSVIRDMPPQFFAAYQLREMHGNQVSHE